MPLAAVTVVTLSSVVRLDAILGEGDKPAGRAPQASRRFGGSTVVRTASCSGRRRIGPLIATRKTLPVKRASRGNGLAFIERADGK